jgi:hypothetical protein
VAPGEDVSSLEDEYRLCGDLPRLVYVKEPVPGREPRLQTLLDRIRDDDVAAGGVRREGAGRRRCPRRGAQNKGTDESAGQCAGLTVSTTVEIGG